MITMSLIGGLGNQMFQYAAGKALAERHGVPLALDISGFRDYALRPFLLDRLLVPEAITAVQAEPAEKPEINFRRAKWKARIDRLLRVDDEKHGVGRQPHRSQIRRGASAQ